MWALHQTGLDLWFKGGTSLSKAGNGQPACQAQLRVVVGLNKETPSMTSIALISKWHPESASAIASTCASLRAANFVDCSFEGYERQSLNPSLRVPPTS